MERKQTQGKINPRRRSAWDIFSRGLLKLISERKADMEK
jgi:hypothetical protein